MNDTSWVRIARLLCIFFKYRYPYVQNCTTQCAFHTFLSYFRCTAAYEERTLQKTVVRTAQKADFFRACEKAARGEETGEHRHQKDWIASRQEVKSWLWRPHMESKLERRGSEIWATGDYSLQRAGRPNSKKCCGAPFCPPVCDVQKQVMWGF